MRVIKFPNLTTITLVFDKYCWSRRNGGLYDPTYAKYPEFRTKVLKMILDMLNDSEKPQGKGIRSLSIKDLQNDNDPKIVLSPQFLELLKRLCKLRLFITTERSDLIGLEWSVFDPQIHSIR